MTRLSFATLLLCSIAPLFAQTDEIQVYNAEIVDQGKFNLEIHNNFTPKGAKSPAFPGGIISNHAEVGTAEWAYGVTDWMEQGLYLPLYSFSHDNGATFNGWKIRELFVRPHAADHTFFYGVNFEFSINQPQWDPRHYTSEVRPIIGWHFKPIDIIINPIMDTDYTGGLKNLDFAPSERVAYNLTDNTALSVEHYSEYGPFKNFLPAGEQFHQLWGVLNHTFKNKIEIETGMGFGLNDASDRMTIKFMIARDLN